MATYNVSEQLLEVLKSASHMPELKLEDFSITAPTATGTNVISTKITLTPYESSHYYGTPHVVYNRFDLSEINQVVVPSREAVNTHGIVNYLAKKRLFKYFVWDEERVNLLSRFLCLRERDFDNILIPSSTVSTLYELAPREDSELFVGKLQVFLQYTPT